MSPSDVIDAVLVAMQHNDEPSPSAGIGVLLSYMGAASSFGEVREPALFVAYITDPGSPYGVLLDWEERVFAGKLEVSLDGRKAYQIVRLRARSAAGKWDWHKVKWALSRQPSAPPRFNPSPVPGDLGYDATHVGPAGRKLMGEGSVWVIDNVLVFTSRR